MNQPSEQFDPYHQWLGIPPEEQPPNHYRLLGIRPLEDNVDVIEHAADRQMAHLKTLQTGRRAALSQKLLNELAAARRCLLAPDRKAAYDQQLTAQLASETQNGANRSTDFEVRTGRHSKRRSGGRRVHRSLITYGVVAIIGLVVGISAYVMWKSENRTASRLVLIWPEEDRKGAVVEIDGRRCNLTTDPATATNQELEFVLEPGEHQLSITRDGSKPLRKSFSLQAGGRVTVNAVLPPEPVTRLVLQWPKTDRAGSTLEIDGRRRDVANAALTGDTEVEFDIDPGEHTLRISRGGEELYSGKFTITEGKRLRLIAGAKRKPTAGRLVLVWPEAQRQGAILEIDGRRKDLARADSVGPDQVEIAVERGKHTYRIRFGKRIVERSFTLAGGQRVQHLITRPMEKPKARLVLVWPEEQRLRATLSIDGRREDISRKLGDPRSDRLLFDLDPGEHTLKATRSGYEDFEHTVDDLQNEVLVAVSWKPSARPRPDPNQLKQAKANFLTAYVEYVEYKNWQKELDKENKRKLLKSLIDRLSAEARNFEINSAEQLVAFEVALELAMDAQEFVYAQGIISEMRQSGSYLDNELTDADDRVWKAALSSTDIDSVIFYVTFMKSQGRLPNEKEQTAITGQLVDAAGPKATFWSSAGHIERLHALNVLSDKVAQKAKVAVFLKAARDKIPSPEDGFALGERLLELVPMTLQLGGDENVRTANALVDAASICRRKAIADRQAARFYQARAARLNDEIKEMRELANLHTRIVEAEQAVAAGNVTDSQHRLLGFWLLRKGEFDNALVHLRFSGDPSLAALGSPLTGTAKELADRADAADEVLQKKKSSEYQQVALRTFANHLRTMAIDKNDGSLDEDAKSRLKTAISNYESNPLRANSDIDKKLPKGRWRRLLEVTSVKEIRELSETNSRYGKWTILDNGTLVCTDRGTSKLEFPIDLSGSYGIRFLCSPGASQNANVVLPVGKNTVVFCLGSSSGRYSGLDRVDGKTVSDTQNPTHIPSSKFAVQSNVPVLVEIHVELLPTDAQSDEQRKLLAGQDLVKIAVSLNRQSMGLITGATSRFTTDGLHSFTSNVIGFSTSGGAAFSNIQLMRM